MSTVWSRVGATGGAASRVSGVQVAEVGRWEEMSAKELSERIAREIALALNESHCTGAPIHQVTHALLGDASDLGDIVDEFVVIIAPIIYAELPKRQP